MGQARHLPIPNVALAAVLACCGLVPAAADQVRQGSTGAQDAATRHQAERTEQANRDATVADEASTARPARAATAEPEAGTRTSPAGTLSYGPVLNPRGPQGVDAARKDPAEVHDEADTLARQVPAQPEQGAQPAAQGSQPRDQRADPAGKQHADQRRAARRRQAWQPEEPMAPRPLHSVEVAPPAAGVPIPPPLAAPQPTVPSSSAIRGCQGMACSDASDNTFNGSGNAGVTRDGRVCTRTGATVQCF